MIENIGWFLMFIGFSFTFFGCLGLVRMPDVFCRLQSATKCVTFGTGSILLGTFFICGFSSIGLKAVICLIFLFLNSPTASHALSKASFIFDVETYKKTKIDSTVREELNKP